MKNVLIVFISLCGVLTLSSQAQARYGSSSGDMWVQILVVAIVLFVIFLLLRELNCWYWKINKGIELLEEIKGLLINNQSNPSQSAPAISGSRPKKVDAAIVDNPIKSPTHGKMVIMVSELSPHSQAEQVGIGVGDIILAYNGEKLSTEQELSKLISMAKYNKKKQVEIKILRDGNEMIVHASTDPLGIATVTEYI